MLSLQTTLDCSVAQANARVSAMEIRAEVFQDEKLTLELALSQCISQLAQSNKASEEAAKECRLLRLGKFIDTCLIEIPQLLTHSPSFCKFSLMM